MRRRRWIGGGRLILEGSRLRAVLIREGRSRNGNHWTRPVLEQIAKLAKGVPINLYDFSANANRRHLSHWEFIRRNLPPAIAAMLPERLGPAQVATVTEARVEGPEGKAEVVADLELAAEKEPLITRIVEAAKKLGKTVGLSIHVPEDGLVGRELQGGDFQPTEVSRLVGFDVVSIPSAGGRIVPVLEALARRTPMKGWMLKLLRVVPEANRPALEALFKKLPDGGQKIESAAALLEGADEDTTAAIVEALDLGDVDDDSLGPCLEALIRTAPKDDPAPKDAKAKKAAAARAKRKKAADAARLEAELDDDDEGGDPDPDPVRADVDLLLVEAGRDTIEAVLEAAKLPGELPDFARKQLTARLESAGRMNRTDAKAFVAELKKSLGKSQARGGGLLEGADHGIEHVSEWNEGFKAELALEALLAGQPSIKYKDPKGNELEVKAYPGIKRAYAEITGDVHCEGRAYAVRQVGRRLPPALESYDWKSNPYAMMRRLRGLEEVTTSGFADIITNVINKRLMREYAMLPHVWRRIASTTPVSDFKARNIHRLGEYPNLTTFAESVAYTPMTDPTEEAVSATIAKYGGLASITWEAVVNDDLRAFRNIPGKLARAADRTLNVSVWNKLLDNDAWGEDSVAFFHVSAWPTGHKNIVAGAYTVPNLEAARVLMTQQKDPDEREAGVVRMVSVFCGTSKFDDVWTDLMSDRRPILTGTDSNAVDGTPNALTMQNPNIPSWARVRDGLTPYEVHQFDEVTGSEDDVIVAADPNITEIMEVGFLNGREEPEIFVQDMERVGSFFDQDVITYKVRHVHDGGVLVDPRGAALIQAP